jgi:hypothetical protein
MDFLAATNDRKFPLKMTGGARPARQRAVEESEPAGNGRRRSKGRQALLDFIPFPLYDIYLPLLDALFLLSEGDDG